MSIINEALKRANQEKGKAPMEFLHQVGRRKRGLNWGPIILLLVLVIVTGPIVAPIFSSPVKQGNSIITVADSNTADQSNRSGQFGMEVAALPAFKPMPGAEFDLSGIVYSEEASYCILNNRVMKVGDTIQGATLTSVTPDLVTLDQDGRTIQLVPRGQ